MSPASGGVSEGLDTALARLLDRSGCVSREELVRALREVREGRGENPNLSLGAELLSRGAVSAADLDRALAELTSPPTASGAPQQIGPYRVLKVLGVGGMGKVFAVEHTETRRQEALKTVEVALDPDEAERFRREAEVLASLDHPGLIRIYGGEFESGRPYLTLELCEGGSLQSRLRHGPLPPEEVLGLAESLGSALDYLHARGVLHRDLKPDNVLFDSEGRPKLTDFGLARVRGAQGLTKTGEILGTPAYMAPEQAGRAHEADARSDVYGFAATLYAAATGRPPFVGAGLFDVLAQVLERPPASPASLGVALPAELEAGILRGLAKDPDERPASAGALVAALGQPTTTRSKGPAAALIVGALAFAASAALVALALSASEASPSPSSLRPTPSATQPPLEWLPPRELWDALAEDSGPMPPAVVAHAWSAIRIEPPSEARKAQLRRRGAEGRLLAAYASLQDQPEARSPCPDLALWADREDDRARFFQECLTPKGLKAIGDPLALDQLKLRLRELTGRYLELIKRQPLPRPLMEHYVGRYQRTYLQARRALRPIPYGEHQKELRALKDATGGHLANVEARVGYYLLAFNQDLPSAGSDGISIDVELSNPGIMEEFGLSLLKIVHHPSLTFAEKEAARLASEAHAIRYTAQDIPARGLLSLQQRLLRHAFQDGRPDLLTRARQAQETVAVRWSTQLRLRRLRNSIVQHMAEGRPDLARKVFTPFDRERATLDKPRYHSFDQARTLFVAQLLLVEGDPEGALREIKGACVGGESPLLETYALKAHALKMQGKPSYKVSLRDFENRSRRGWGVPLGLEWYLHDARGIIEGDTWWPGDGPREPR